MLQFYNISGELEKKSEQLVPVMTLCLRIDIDQWFSFHAFEKGADFGYLVKDLDHLCQISMTRSLIPR